MAYEYRINGTLIKPPTTCAIEKYNLTKVGRVANGDMQMELVAKKRKFILRWSTIDSRDLAVIEQLIDGTDMFFTFEYIEDNTRKSAVVYTGAINKPPPHHKGSLWHYPELELRFIEQ